jgi:hypothetical protein
MGEHGGGEAERQADHPPALLPTPIPYRSVLGDQAMVRLQQVGGHIADGDDGLCVLNVRVGHGGVRVAPSPEENKMRYSQQRARTPPPAVATMAMPALYPHPFASSKEKEKEGRQQLTMRISAEENRVSPGSISAGRVGPLAPPSRIPAIVCGQVDGWTGRRQPVVDREERWEV